MQYKYNIKAVYRLIGDWTGEADRLFGNIPVIFGNDFA